MTINSYENLDVLHISGQSAGPHSRKMINISTIFQYFIDSKINSLGH